MPVSEVLKGFRSKGYESEENKEESSGSRLIKLTDDEAKALSQYGEEGKEVTCQVTGRLNGSEFSVTSVSASGNSEEEEMAKEMMGGSMGGPPLMQNQTMPSPS